jgi:hypothetical protein
MRYVLHALLLAFMAFLPGVANAEVKQIKLTEKQIQAFVSAQKELASMAEKMPSDDKPDPKIQAQLEFNNANTVFNSSRPRAVSQAQGISHSFDHDSPAHTAKVGRLLFDHYAMDQVVRASHAPSHDDNLFLFNPVAIAQLDQAAQQKIILILVTQREARDLSGLRSDRLLNGFRDAAADE